MQLLGDCFYDVVWKWRLEVEDTNALAVQGWVNRARCEQIDIAWKKPFKRRAAHDDEAAFIQEMVEEVARVENGHHDTSDGGCEDTNHSDE